MTRSLAVWAALCAAVAQAPAQTPVVGDINTYGLRKITAARVISALGVKSGAPLPPSKGEMEDTLEKIPGVVIGRVEAVCCEGPEVVLFIGVEEKGAPHAGFRTEPAGTESLPEDLADSYRQFLAAVQRAVGRGGASEDLTAGHSVMADPEAHAFQEQFGAFAAGRLDLLRGVLRTAAEPEQRAIAAAVIDYYPGDKKAIIDDLQFAMQDPDDAVRANAARSLMAIGVLAAKQPELGIRISPTWFIELLNSVVLSDRIESAKALLTLTDREAPLVLQQLREKALVELAEMARWKTPRYALPAFLLLGRVAGLPDDQTQQAWQKQDREAVIQKALDSAGRKRPA